MSTRRWTVSVVGAGLEIVGTVSGCMNWVDEGAPPRSFKGL